MPRLPRVPQVFTEQFLPAIHRLDPSRDLSDAEVSTVIRNGAGVGGSLLVPQVGFHEWCGDMLRMLCSGIRWWLLAG
jgi:hypothetical protein